MRAFREALEHWSVAGAVGACGPGRHGFASCANAYGARPCVVADTLPQLALLRPDIAVLHDRPAADGVAANAAVHNS